MTDPEYPDTETSVGARTNRESVTTERLSTAAFDLITNETRAAILATLARAQATDPHEPELAFTTLRERAEIDDSGNFNYHLSKLQPEYVTGTESGYVLTNASLRLLGILRAGVGTEVTRGPEPLNASCSVCEMDLAVSYDDGMLSVKCENGHRFPQDWLPPNAVAGRDCSEIIQIQTYRTQHSLDLVSEGVCPACFDPVSREHRVVDAPQGSHVLVATCDGCGRVLAAPIGMYLLSHPAVIGFYHDHGINVPETPLWEIELTVAEPTVVSEDPTRLSLSVECEDEQLRLLVSERAELIESTRTFVED